MKTQSMNTTHIVIVIILSIALILFSTEPLRAEPDAINASIMFFLRTSPSTQANAMGQTYGNTFHNSPMASIFHPASLGLFARGNNFGHSFYIGKVDRAPEFMIDHWYDASCTALGFNLKDYSDIPVSIGLGFHEVYQNQGLIFSRREDRWERNTQSGERSSNYDRSKGTTISVAFDYIARVSFGHTWKKAELHRWLLDVENPATELLVKTDATDFGFIVEIPLVPLLKNIVTEIEEPLPNTKFYFDPGFFYSKTNIAEKVSTTEGNRQYPLPRMVSLGINLKTGLSYLIGSDEIKLLGFNWSQELDETLIKSSEDHSTAHTRGLQDIRLFENLILGIANEKVDAFKQGFEINFADCFYLRHGRYENNEEGIKFTSKGWGINYTEIVRLPLKLFSKKENWLFHVIKNLSLEQHHSEYETKPMFMFDGSEFPNPFEGIKYNSYVIRFRIVENKS